MRRARVSCAPRGLNQAAGPVVARGALAYTVRRSRVPSATASNVKSDLARPVWEKKRVKQLEFDDSARVSRVGHDSGERHVAAQICHARRVAERIRWGELKLGGDLRPSARGRPNMMKTSTPLTAIVACLLPAFTVDGAYQGGAGSEATRVVVSEQACPLQEFTARASDAHETVGIARKPPGSGPFPAMIYLHGGLEPLKITGLRKLATDGKTLPRFLAAGYVTVDATFRSRLNDALSTGPLLDCLAIVDRVRKMPEVDPDNIVIWGDSGGGSLALELAGETDLRAIAVQEPATILFAGLFSVANIGPPDGPSYMQNRKKIVRDPKRYTYAGAGASDEVEKIAKIHCPIFVAHGDMEDIEVIDHQIFIPALKEAGKSVEVIIYPGEPHGFSNGRGTPQGAKILRRLPRPSLLKLTPSFPAAGSINASLVREVPFKS